jgi:hypothetical protein
LTACAESSTTICSFSPLLLSPPPPFSTAMTESRPPVAKPPRQTSKLPTEDQKSAAAALEKSIPVLKKERKPKRPRTTAAEGGEGADADVDGGKERKKAKKSVKKQGLADSEAVKARTKEAIREEEARIAAEGGPKELTKKEQRRRRKQEKERLEGGKKEVEVEAKVQPKPLVLPKGALPVHKDESLSVQAQKGESHPIIESKELTEDLPTDSMVSFACYDPQLLRTPKRSTLPTLSS